MIGTNFGRTALRFPQKFTRPCSAAQWRDGVLTVSTTAALSNPPQFRQFDDIPIGLAPDRSGGAFVLAAASAVSWGGQGPLSLARISPTGVRGPVTVLSLPHAWIGVLGVWSDGAIVASDSGRCIVVWSDHQFHAGLVAQRYDSAGAPSWNPDPVTASTATPGSFSTGIVAEPDGSDGVITAWYPENFDPSSSPIRTQRISATGALLYGVDGLMLGPAAMPFAWYNSPWSWLQLVPDGQGGGTVLWANQTTTGANYVAQKFSGNGAMLGAPVTIVSQVPNGWRSMRRVRRAVSDGAGGFFLAYSDQGGVLNVLRCSAATNVLWSVPVVTPTHPMAFDIREDGQGGILLALAFTSIIPRLEVRRFDAAGAVTWELISGIQFLLPTAAAAWPAQAWADLVKVVPDGIGGAIVVFQFWQGNGSKPQLRSFCVNARGKVVSQPQNVSARPTRQDFPVAISGGGPSAIIAWADDGDAATTGLDVWTQRVGCCPLSPAPVSGLELEPELPCAIIELPGLPYRELAVRLPCGNRELQFGFIPLTRLPTIVGGLDVPAGLSNRDTPLPNWMRINFLGLPPAMSVELQTRKKKVIARSVVIHGPGKTVAGRALTFKPSNTEEQFIILSHKGAPIGDPGITARVNVEWGDGKAPALPRPARPKA